MESIGKRDVALTEDALFAEMHRQMDNLEIICDSDPAETWESFCEGLKRLLALAKEAVRLGYLPKVKT